MKLIRPINTTDGATRVVSKDNGPVGNPMQTYTPGKKACISHTVHNRKTSGCFNWLSSLFAYQILFAYICEHNYNGAMENKAAGQTKQQ